MGGLVTAIVLGLLALFSAFLPASPFANLALPAAFGDALGWLNWLLPVGDMLGIFYTWLAAVVLYIAVRFMLKMALRLGTKEGDL